MIYNLIVKPRAENDLAIAIDWYESKQKGLGLKLLNTVQKFIAKIRKNPLHYPLKRSPFREVFIKEFPYVIIYEVIEEEIIIYSVFHAHQNPEKKLLR